MKTVSEGYLIDFLQVPFQNFIPKSVLMSIEMQGICDVEVENLIAKGAISEVRGDSPGFVCSFFCISKRNGSWRPIVNLRPLNMFIKYDSLTF